MVTAMILSGEDHLTVTIFTDCLIIFLVSLLRRVVFILFYSFFRYSVESFVESDLADSNALREGVSRIILATISRITYDL